MKEIRFSQHSLDKLAILNNRGILVRQEFVTETVRNPDQLDIKENDKKIAQKALDKNLVLRVVYREFNTFILIITLYPGRRIRYE